MSQTREKYIRRLERKSPPEVVAAYREGILSARSARCLVKLSVAKQLAFLRRQQNQQHWHKERCRQVAEAISRYLDDCTGRPDLEQLRLLLRQDSGAVH